MPNNVGHVLFEVTPAVQHLANLCEKNNAIDKELYTKYEVKCRGQRPSSHDYFVEVRQLFLRRQLSKK